MRTPAYTAPQITNPRMAETRAGSIFTPAIAAWSSPGALGALALPAWASYLIPGGLLALAAMKKIPWWAGIVGAGAAWYLLTPATPVTTQVNTGTGIVANGTTIQFSVNSPGTLTTAGSNATMSVGGNNYPVLQTQANPDGTVTYYLDNPSAS